jgi:hypothetical protein
LRSTTAMTVHGQPDEPDAIMRFIRNRPLRPFPSILRTDVYEDQYEVTEHDPHGRFGFLAQKIEESRHGIPDRLAVEWLVQGGTKKLQK